MEAKLIKIAFEGATGVVFAERFCPQCKAFAVVKLPENIRVMQPDKTTHVCAPGAGGCNQGYHLD